jgi:hypothetical protein
VLLSLSIGSGSTTPNLVFEKIGLSILALGISWIIPFKDRSGLATLKMPNKSWMNNPIL